MKKTVIKKKKHREKAKTKTKSDKPAKDHKNIQ